LLDPVQMNIGVGLMSQTEF